MFKSVKKAISGIFGARAVAKPRRNVIALPVEAPNNEEALVDARRGLLAVLEEILQGKKDAEEEAIDNLLDALHVGFYAGYYYWLNKLGLVAPDWCSDDARWGALAAAIEYAAGCFPVDVQTIEFALRLVKSGNYTHFAEVDNDEELGLWVLYEVERCNVDEEFIAPYFDAAACGRDYREYHRGKFTQYGFFAEL